MLFIGALLPAACAHYSRMDVRAISEAAGVEAGVKDSGVVRIGWIRDAVPVTIDGMPFPPAAGLGSWAAFKALPDGGVMMMGIPWSLKPRSPRPWTPPSPMACT